MNTKWRRGATAVAVLLAHLTAATGQRVYEAGPEAAFRQLERDIPSLYLINGLYLAPEQNDRLAQILDDVRRLEADTLRDFARIERSYDGDLVRAAGRTLSGRREETDRLRQARDEIRARHQETRARLDRASREVWDILTPSQREIIYSFTPCFIPPQDFREPVRVGQAEKSTEFGENVLARLRTVPEGRLDAARERALELMVPYVMKERYITYSEEAERKVKNELTARLGAALPKLRSLSDVDYELEKADLVRQIMPIEDEGKLAQEFSDALWKSSAYVLNPGCLDVILARGRKPAAAGASIYVAGEMDSLKKERDRLQAGLVISRLGLTPGQVEQVLPVVRAGADAALAIEREADATKREAVFAYEALRKELAAGAPTPEAENAANGYHAGVKKMYEEDLLNAIRPHENQLDTLLAAEQVAALIEPDDKGPRGADVEPRRTATEDRRLALQTLDGALKLNPAEFERSKQHVAGVYVASCLGHGEDGSGVDVNAQTARAVGVLEKARAMNRQDLARRRLELAVELCPRRMTPRPPSYGNKYHGGEPVPELEQSSRLLFTQAAVDMLQRMAKP